MPFMFENLEVYQKAIAFADEISNLTEDFSKGNYYLTDSFDHESERLKTLGFKNIKTYSYLDDSCLSGCVIYNASNTSEAEVLKKFIEDKKPDQYKVGYVLYTRDRIDHDLFKNFNNITFANSPLTLINAVYAVARGTIK